VRCALPGRSERHQRQEPERQVEVDRPPRVSASSAAGAIVWRGTYGGQNRGGRLLLADERGETPTTGVISMTLTS
jgi:hypothetical protein